MLSDLRYWWKWRVPDGVKGILFVVGVLIAAFTIAYPAVQIIGSHEKTRCDAVHGHIYNAGRDTLCLTGDNRVITNW